jgi:3-oxoacyl-[acyl-carrier protein] reductase
MGNLNGKVAIVTGASKGIGAAIAKSLAAAGAAVAVNYSSSREGADRTVAAIVGKGGKAVAIQGNMAKAADVKRLFEVTKKELGTPSVLVNNAGVFQFDPIERVTEAEFHRHFDTNVLGPILAIQEALKHFPDAGGSIVNISSIASQNPVPTSSIYSASKAAVDMLTLALAKELGPRKIRVNTVAPGGTATEGNVASGIVGSEIEKAMVSATPLGRFGQPEDIAPIVVFLASDESAWITGERVAASGGLR